jgi:cobyrinic acid a,c-diamide synthase
MAFPRIIISATRGGSGKTILSIGIIAAWKSAGKLIAPFKKGPDYIDAGWLALAAGRPCYNLDTFLISREKILSSFFSHTFNEDIAVIEGNRGLFDGIDLQGSTSTAELAKLIRAPVVLCINCTKTTRTMAAVVSGCAQFDHDVRIKGVILNRVAGSRHEKILRSSIEHHCGIPVLGAVPKLSSQYFPERHMGLLPTPEHSWAKDSIAAAARVAKDYLDLEGLLTVALDAMPLAPETRQPEAALVTRLELGEKPVETPVHEKTAPGNAAYRIGVIRDSAFQFYYPENLEALEQAGGVVEFISPLAGEALPELDALYIGGGFPETHVEQLSENRQFRDDIKRLADKGLPVYAECGGLMYLGERLIVEGKSYPMAGVLPVVYDVSKRPQGHGYTMVRVEGDNPFFPAGTEIRGHEFHYSRVVTWGGSDKDLVFRMDRGKGFYNGRDGVCYQNVLATYTHIHALGTPGWAEAVVRNAARYRKAKKTGQTP